MWDRSENTDFMPWLGLTIQPKNGKFCPYILIWVRDRVIEARNT